MMKKKQHLSPAQFDAFMKKRWLKKLHNIHEGEKPAVIGCLHDMFFPDNKLVACANCGIPLYVRPWVYKIAHERGFPIFCQFCVPSEEVKGTIVQDLAALDDVERGELK
jgi:hypothetical protein